MCDGFCCIDCYRHALDATSPSADGHVRLRMKYNTAVLRSRRLQKHIAELSLASLPAENTVSRQGPLDDLRHVQGVADSQIPGTRLYHRPTAHSKESARGGTLPSDYRCLHSKPVTYQNKVENSDLATRTCVGSFSDGSLRTMAPITYMIKRTESDKTAAKNSARVITGGSVTSAIPLSPEEARRLLMERENAKLLETYATLPRKSRQQKAALQHRPKSTEMPQRTFHSGISRTSGYVSQNTYVQKDKMSLAVHDSLSHLKITWLVAYVIIYRLIEIASSLKLT